MSISFDEKACLFNLSADGSTYQIKISELGYLLHVYYGAKTQDDCSYLIQSQDRGFSGNPASAPDRTFSLDTLPQEYPTCGTGDYRETCLEQLDELGRDSAVYTYCSHRIIARKPPILGLPAARGIGDDIETLEITLWDEAFKTELVLQYSVFEKANVITRNARIYNKGKSCITLERALSFCVDFNVPRQFELMTFFGRHCGERTAQRTPLTHGKFRIDSARGVSSPQYNPFAILCESKTDETSGECYGFCLEYSGNFILQAEKDQISQTRIVGGINPQEFRWQLAPGDSFQTPEVMMAYSSSGFGRLSNIFNKAIEKYICDSRYAGKDRPVLINNWEATYFDFDESKICNIIREAGKMGIELFVLDDGWFGHRNDDTSSLGDWFVNTEKLPGGLRGLADAAKQNGMEFGIWIEPEMISPDSELYRTHSDWCLAVPGRQGTLSRSQWVLDMSRRDVQDHLFESISEILNSADISYIKWDMNRHLCEKFSYKLEPDRQGELSHRYILGVYSLLERIREAFPDVLIESCSGGGGRFDAGMLYYTPQIWCSDNTDAIARIEIQYGTSFCYPQSCISAHVSAVPNHQTGRITPLHTRGTAAMTGAFGYELDILKLDQDEKNRIAEQIKFYKSQTNLIRNGSYYRLTDTYDARHGTWMTVSEDRCKALLSHVYTDIFANGPEICVRLQGLKDDTLYRNTINDLVLSGKTLMNAGFVLPIPKSEYEAVQVEFYAVDISKS